jgi:exoribonuclease R
LTLQELTPQGEVVGERFVKSVIASKEAFTYEAAQVRKDDKWVFVPSAYYALPGSAAV